MFTISLPKPLTIDEQEALLAEHDDMRTLLLALEKRDDIPLFLREVIAECLERVESWTMAK